MQTMQSMLRQVRALEKEMVARAESAGVPDIQPRILVLTRLIPDARGTSCDEPYERISGTEHAAIVRIPFHDSKCAFGATHCSSLLRGRLLCDSHHEAIMLALFPLPFPLPISAFVCPCLDEICFLTLMTLDRQPI